MRGIYAFIKGVPGKLGVGVSDLGLERPSTVPIQSIYGQRYNVRHHLGPVAPGYAKVGQQVVPVSMLGNSGIYLAGQIKLQTLAQKG